MEMSLKHLHFNSTQVYKNDNQKVPPIVSQGAHRKDRNWLSKQGGCVCVCVCPSVVSLSATPCKIVCVCPSVVSHPMECTQPGFTVHGIPRQEYWSELPFPSLGYLHNPGIEPKSPALQADSLLSDLPG